MASPKLCREALLQPAADNNQPQGHAQSPSASSEPSTPSALPKNISGMSRLALNLQFLISAATSHTSSLAKTDALTPLLLEARAAVQLATELGPTSHPSQNPTPTPKELSGINSLLSTTSPSSHGASSHSVRYIVAACRCPNSKAAFYLEQAVQCGSVVASVELAVCLLYGLGSRADPNRALQLLDDGVSAGHPGAMYVVGKCLRDGVGVPADLTTGVVWLKRAADLDYIPALHELGEMYEDGIAKTSSSGRLETEKADDAPEEDIAGGPITLDGLDKNLVLAMRYYKRAATLGFPASQLNLAKLFLMSSTIDATDTVVPEGALVVANNQQQPALSSLGEYQMKALYWLKKSADLGNQEARTLLLRTSPPPLEANPAPDHLPETSADQKPPMATPSAKLSGGSGIGAVKALKMQSTAATTGNTAFVQKLHQPQQQQQTGSPAPRQPSSAPSAHASPPRPHLRRASPSPSSGLYVL